MWLAKRIPVGSAVYRRLNLWSTRLDSLISPRLVLVLPIGIFYTAGAALRLQSLNSEAWWVASLSVSGSLAAASWVTIAIGLIGSPNRNRLPIFGFGGLIVAALLNLVQGTPIAVMRLASAGVFILGITRKWRVGGISKLAPTKRLAASLGISAACSLLAGWGGGLGEFHAGLAFALPLFGFAAALLLVMLALGEPIYDPSAALPSRSETPRHRRTYLLSALIAIVVVAVAGFFHSDPVSSTAAAVSAPFLAVALFFPRRDYLVRALMYPLLVLAVFVAARLPWSFAALIVPFDVLRRYYYFRHGVFYPTFRATHD